jgi:TetR/AcrR family transcriptional regulator
MSVPPPRRSVRPTTRGGGRPARAPARTAASGGPLRRRDADSSRQTILDAAEQLFALRGYDASSLHEIGRRAGVSTALPAYFFGSKEGLYEAVLERLLAERERRLAPLAAGAQAELARSGELRPALELLIGGYIAFLRERPALVRLMAREALDGARRLWPGPRHSVAVQGGLAAFVRSLQPRPGPSVDAEQLLITTVALCFFPIEHNDTMLAAMGLDATDEHFAKVRTRHVVDVLERVLSGGDR